MNHQPLLAVRDLSISYHAAGQATQAVKHLSFTLNQGETVAIVGESGSGKSTLANALLGLLPPAARIDHGQLWVDGLDVARASERQSVSCAGAPSAWCHKTQWSASTPPCALASR